MRSSPFPPTGELDPTSLGTWPRSLRLASPGNDAGFPILGCSDAGDSGGYCGQQTSHSHALGLPKGLWGPACGGDPILPSPGLQVEEERGSAQSTDNIQESLPCIHSRFSKLSVPSGKNYLTVALVPPPFPPSLPPFPHHLFLFLFFWQAAEYNLGFHSNHLLLATMN